MAKNTARSEKHNPEQLELPKPIMRLPTSKAQNLGFKRMRQGQPLQHKTDYGVLLAVCTGKNPEDQRENLWEIFFQETA